MTTNTIIDKLARTIERKELNDGVNNLPFIYADLDTQNILIDNTGVPFAAAAPLSSGMVTDEHGFYHERATFEVFFGDLMAQSLPDYNARENERIIDTCKRRAFAWLASLLPANELRLVSINSATRTYMQFDAIVTGYLVNVTIEEVQGYGRCENFAQNDDSAVQNEK